MAVNARFRVLYSVPDEDGNIRYWYAETLWQAAENAVITEIEVSSLEILDDVVWFGGPKKVLPTIRNISDRVKDILNADLSYPIIKMKNGEVLDGAHRIARAYIENKKYLKAVVLDDYPAHDGVVKDGEIAPPPPNR